MSKERHLKIENTRGADGHFGVMGFSISTTLGCLCVFNGVTVTNLLSLQPSEALDQVSFFWRV